MALEAAEKSDFSVLLTGETFQTVEGFGFAITQASCFNLLRMPEADRKQFLTEMFSREKGLGSSLIRVCIGGSDFSLDEFTWCDKQGLDNFAVHPLDEQYLFPILDEIFAINPKVKIIASPWSCPKWMKMDDNGRTPFDSWTSGRLNPVCYQEYANYFALWIREMEKRAAGMGVTVIRLDTFGWQGKEFYEAMGYECAGHYEIAGEGWSEYFFLKRLNPEETGNAAGGQSKDGVF